jgi:transcriptional regulator with AAA-type ATPase domain
MGDKLTRLLEGVPELARVSETVLASLRDDKYVLLVGPPGSGKMLLIQAIHEELANTWHPTKSTQEVIFNTYIRAGLLTYQTIVAPTEVPWKLPMPFRIPHHTVSRASMIGDLCTKCNQTRPGELHIANGGVLVLDEIDEFSKHVLDCITASSLSLMSTVRPSKFSCIATTNELTRAIKYVPKELLSHFVVVNMPMKRTI